MLVRIGVGVMVFDPGPAACPDAGLMLGLRPERKSVGPGGPGGLSGVEPRTPPSRGTPTDSATRPRDCWRRLAS